LDGSAAVCSSDLPGGDNKGHHFIADLQVSLGSVIDGLYHPGRIHPGDKRTGLIAGAATSAAHGISRTHRGSLNANQDFSRTRRRGRKFVNRQDVWTTGGIKCNCFHMHDSRTAGSSIPVSDSKMSRCQSSTFSMLTGNVMGTTLVEG